VIASKPNSTKEARPVARLLADILFMFGFILFIPAILAYVMKEQAMWMTFGGEGLLCILIAASTRRKTSTAGMKQYQGAIVLALAWIVISIISSIPFLVDGLGLVDSLFESFSGWTNTGVSMIPDPEQLPLSLGLFRAMSQWLSGLGLVLMLINLRGPSPQVMQRLFQAEGRFEDFNTSIWKMGRTIAFIYFGYTLAGFLGMWMAGVPPFHALTHTMTSLSTGGFSSNSIGIGIYGAIPTVIAIILMILGGISFSSHQALFAGNYKKFIQNPEVRAFAVILVVSSSLALLQMKLANLPVMQNALDSIFYVVSAASTTGAHTVMPLPEVPDVFLFLLTFLMAIGASYGSATGGIKLWRLIILGKIIFREVRQPFFPTGTILPIRMGHNVISEESVGKVAGYTMLYMSIALAGSLIFMMFGYRALDSLFVVFSSQGNVGLTAMPAAVHFGMHPVLKLLLILHMLVGRLEIFPLLFLFVGIRNRNW
jgi:trk system potassium uptake protein TrkH